MYNGDGEALNPEGIVNFYKAFWREVDRDLRSRNPRTRYQVKKFCRSAWCRLLVEGAGGNYEAFLEAKGLAECILSLPKGG